MKCTDEKMKAVIYARVSSKEQEKEGFSVPAQLKLLKEYASARGFQVVQEFIEIETAKKAGRTGFIQMLNYFRANADVRIVLTEKTDRLYRNFRDYVTLDDLNLAIHLVKENEVLSRESRSHQKLMHEIKLVMAKNYIDNLSEETKKGMTEKVEQGGYPHRAPIGYKNDPTNHTVPVDPQKAPYIQKMYESYATGRFSLADIRLQCLDIGFKGSLGNRPISKSKVELILKNPFYVGQFRWKGRLYKGNHEPIISSELFQRVQDVFELRRGKAPRSSARDFTFGGLMICGSCGCAVTAEIHKGKYVYYHCTNFHKTCDQAYYREEKLAGQFDNIVRGVVLDREIADWVKDALKESLDDETAFHRDNLSLLQENLDQVKRRLNQAYIDKLDGKITDDFWREKSEDWQREQMRLTGLIERHLHADHHYLESGAQILELSQKAYALYSEQEPGEKRKLLQLLLSNCTLKDGIITPKYNQPFDILADMSRKATDENMRFGEKLPKIENWGPLLGDFRTALQVKNWTNAIDHLLRAA